MLAKANAIIQMQSPRKLQIELWDVDVLVDDKIQSQEISDSGPVEFLFSVSDTGEINPELQLRVVDEDGNILLKSRINSEINSAQINDITGFIEKTTIDFGVITI
jgi:hypothetical protein